MLNARTDQMRTVRIGTVMMQAGTLMPASMRVEAAPYSRTWQMIKNLDADSLDRQLRTAGWNLFFMAANLQGFAWGRFSEKTLQTAIKRMLGRATLSEFNCLQVTEILAKRFLGFSYIRVSGHSRHIQQSAFLKERKKTRPMPRK